MTRPHARRVLIVDDEDPIRTLVARVLDRAGFQPVQATDGVEAIECLDENRFDAVVLDLMMPRVDGFGVVQHLSETQPAMIEKTVVVTAGPHAEANARLNHVCGVLSKPFDLAELVSKVEECARR